MEAPVDKKQETSPAKQNKDRKRKYNQKNGQGNQNQEKNEKHQKKQHHEKYQKKERPQKPQRQRVKNQYQYNADLITQDTVIPALPKKNQELKKPERDDFKGKQNKVRDKINALKDEIKKIRSQKFTASKKYVKGQDNAHDQFRQQIEEIQQLRQRLKQQKSARNQARDKFNKLIEQAKDINNQIKELKAKLKNSSETLQSQISALQKKLIGGDITKDQQKQLNSDIMIKKRVLKDASSSQQLQVRLEKAQDRRDQLSEQIDNLKAEKEPLQIECKQLIQKIDQKNAAIDKLKGIINNENTKKTQAKQTNDKAYQQWKQGKKKRQDQVYDKIRKLQQDIDKIWDDYGVKRQQYWKQKHYIDFIKWQTKVKDRKANDRIRQEKRKEYQEKQKQREKQQVLKKHIGEIELCNFLINYCRSLYPQDSQNSNQNEKVEEVDIQKKLKEDSAWKKQKGLQIIQSKKTKQDDEPVKKGKKYNKKKQQKKEQKFEVPFNMQTQFEKLKVLAPQSVEDIERTIKQLKERQQLFERACVQNPTQEDQNMINDIKTKKSKKNKQESKKEDDDFPTL